MRLLLLSNSTMPGEPYLGWPSVHIKEFLSGLKGQVLFIPYAAVTISFDEYSQLTADAFGNFGFDMVPIHTQQDKAKAVKEAVAIAVGGGNTFHLLKHLQDEGLIDPIRNAAKNGTPYIGWSAGSNVACSTINTTNDMPIVQPHSFKALDLVDFQINPHYTNRTIEGHGGESREQRLLEFLEVNKKASVLGLAEGSLLRIEEEMELVGAQATVFKYGKRSEQIPAGFLPKIQV